jgi:hypothetical protein
MRKLTSKAREFARRKTFWLIAAFYLGLIGLADYHYSMSNQIPSDGPLTIGFPMTFYWMVCPMIASGAGACQRGISAFGFIVDLIVCIALAMVAASLSMHFARKDFVKRALFWISVSVVFSFTFLLASLVTAFHSASHHARAIEIGFPAVYLYEYAGDSLDALNLATDLVICFVAAFLCVASFFRKKMDGSK